MYNELCDIYGMDVPIFAFGHSTRVIAVVSKSGDFGVLGAAGMEPEELDQALIQTRLIDRFTCRKERTLHSGE